MLKVFRAHSEENYQEALRRIGEITHEKQDVEDRAVQSPCEGFCFWLPCIFSVAEPGHKAMPKLGHSKCIFCDPELLRSALSTNMSKKTVINKLKSIKQKSEVVYAQALQRIEMLPYETTALKDFIEQGCWRCQGMDGVACIFGYGGSPEYVNFEGGKCKWCDSELLQNAGLNKKIACELAADLSSFEKHFPDRYLVALGRASPAVKAAREERLQQRLEDEQLKYINAEKARVTEAARLAIRKCKRKYDRIICDLSREKDIAVRNASRRFRADFDYDALICKLGLQERSGVHDYHNCYEDMIYDEEWSQYTMERKAALKDVIAEHSAPIEKLKAKRDKKIAAQRDAIELSEENARKSRRIIKKQRLAYDNDTVETYVVHEDNSVTMQYLSGKVLLMPTLEH